MSELANKLGRCELALDRGDFKLRAEFDLPAQGITGLFGPSGSGKTTVLRCLAGLEPNVQGRVQIANAVWQDSATRVFVPAYRREVGYVFHGARLFSHLDVAGNIEYGRRRARRESDVSYEHICELLGIDALIRRKTSQLSRGEQQRVAIARALLRSPQLLLMDEPLSGLDSDSRREILPFLDRLRAALQIPILYVSHNIDETTHLSDHLIVMRQGRVTETGALEHLLSDAEIFGADASGVVLDAVVDGYDAGNQLSSVRFGGGTLLVPGKLANDNEAVRLRVLARDVSISLHTPPRTSILNQVEATVERISDRGGPHVQIELRAGTSRLVASVSRLSRTDLALREGQAVIAQIKGVAVKAWGTFS
ncbi:MAG: molybdenum ABC transporter ATP-binding protein [Gammaproteobacteria bacterium]|nr:molybdenum ABC transporter ATP-binding protein [Gammaproteobacteria bacterium]MDH3767348.1 molybdenum ABC transporter ATP-binding protein [Gammaproteobacteria bacterium]